MSRTRIGTTETLDAVAPNATLDSTDLTTGLDLERAPLESGFRERYDVVGLIGEGGMGEVLGVRDRTIGRLVALKRVRAEHVSPDARARFLREARVQGQLEHPSIVPVYDVGCDPDGREYFVMQRIGGRSLNEMLATSSREPMSRRLLEAFTRVCQAISFAHERGVLHRDLKPGNAMLGQHGEVYVLDWGLLPEDALPAGTSVAPPPVAG